jgi:ketosteroid isomerase-like protein
MELVHPDIVARLALPPGASTEEYRGHGEIAGFLDDGDARYDRFDAEPRAFAVGPTGRVFAEGSVSYGTTGSAGIASVAYWVCEVRDGKIVSWESFGDRRRALTAAGFDDSASRPRDALE